MTLSPKLGVVGISTLWHFRLPLPIQMFIKVASSPRLSGIGMPSPILWSHPLKMQRIVLLSSLLWWELGTNSLITGPGEWLSFRRFTSKLSWSWSWSFCPFSLSLFSFSPPPFPPFCLPPPSPSSSRPLHPGSLIGVLGDLARTRTNLAETRTLLYSCRKYS